eukprot:CAMPEP_0178938352 /NCGR_PEP_ID=MMETSP0786-20121207/26282_1 /TAXON_ID=186022 /ORGANISM="Thalassionema frauenfeldii, Strain CCMP 1798" /LENGTH=724 /DNA_ID=CAMNT_0020617059 /DNA_START=337 /DNA_END=2511 /DNA_ORIENTATION=+
MKFPPLAVELVLLLLSSTPSTTDAFVVTQRPNVGATRLKYKIIDPNAGGSSSSSSSSMNAGSGIGFGAGDNLSANNNNGGGEKEYKSELVARWEKEQAQKNGGGGGGGTSGNQFGSGAGGVPGFGAPSSPSGGGGGGNAFGSGASGVPGFGAPSAASSSSSSSSSSNAFGSGAGGVPGFGAPGGTNPTISSGSSSSSSSSWQSPTASTATSSFSPGSSSNSMGGGMSPPMGSSSSSSSNSMGGGMSPPMGSSSMGGGMSPPMGGGMSPPMGSSSMGGGMSTGGGFTPPPSNTNMPPPMGSSMPPLSNTGAATSTVNSNGPVYTQEPGTNGLDLDTSTPDTMDMPVYNDYDEGADVDDPYLDELVDVPDDYVDPRDDFDDRRAGYEMELLEEEEARARAREEEEDVLRRRDDETLNLMEENRRLKEQLMRASRGRRGAESSSLPYEGRLVARTDADLRQYQQEQEESSPHYGIELRRRKRAQQIQRRQDYDAKLALLEGNFELPGERLIQGQTLLTWSFMSPAIRRVQCHLATEGRPIDAQVELWDGPDNVPHKMSIYSESGYEHPFNAIVQTPGGWNTLAVKNTGSMDFPLKANCEAVDPNEPTLGFIDPTDARTQGPQTVQGGALRSYTFDASVASVQILIKTQGRPIQCKIELIQGPNNNKQVMEVYTQNGQTYPFYAIVETLGRGSVIRIINEAPMEFPIIATAAPYKISFQNDNVLPTIR